MPRTGARVTRRSARSAKQARGKVDPVAEALRWLQEKRATQVKIAGVDLDGVLRGKYVSLDKFASVAGAGLGFCDVVFGWDLADELYDNAQVTGWHTGYPDLQARVDLSTARMIPWEPATAAFLLDFVMPDGSDYAPSPRALLRRVGHRARSMGFLPKFGSEYEFFIFKETPTSARAKGFQNLEPLDPGMFGYSWLRTSQSSDLVHALLDGCNAFGLEVEAFHTETGPGVYETAIHYDVLEPAGDKSVLFKSAVKEICARHGLTACFMSKPSARLPGCSGHVHQSLWTLDGGRNTFHDPRAPEAMSTTLRHYLGGQLKLMPELTALYWPTINSYKRSVENTWAPTCATWGRENRTCALRVIGTEARTTRVEFRLLGADMNPYVGMAASLAAGLWGIEHRVEPGEPVTGNAYRIEAAPLPRNLRDAIGLLDRSTVARELLGEEFVDHYLRTRTWEVRQYERAVTTWELERYFELA
jgi:glutamine synthetase